jgi:RNA polymerase sigma-70 factor (ECF subfamily)
MVQPAPVAHETHSDRDLLRRIGSGEPRALRVLYERYYRRLFSFVFKITRRPELVDEVLNDVMLAVWRQAAGFEGRSRVSTWIFGIAHKQSLKSLRRERGGPSGDAVVSEPDELPGPEGSGPETRTARRELASVLARAMATLPPEQRAVVELTFYYGFSYPEIASIVGCPTGTVKTRMFHARRKLRVALADVAEVAELGAPNRGEAG